MNGNAKEDVAATETKGVSGILGCPEGFIRGLCGGGSIGRPAALLLLLAVGGAAVFGFGAGSFVDWLVALLDGLKAGGIVLFSYLLCLPALYVFNSIAGCRVGFIRLALIGLVVLAGMGCVLAALAPILWLFAVSTASTTGFVVIAMVMIVVAFAFGFRTLSGAVKSGAVAHSNGLFAWMVILFFVVMQTITLVRPMLSPVGTARSPEGKCFFLQHFAETWGR